MEGGAEFPPILILFGLGALLLMIRLFQAFRGLFYFLIFVVVIGGLVTIRQQWFDKPPEQFIPLAMIVFCVVMLILRLLLRIHDGKGRD